MSNCVVRGEFVQSTEASRLEANCLADDDFEASSSMLLLVVLAPFLLDVVEVDAMDNKLLLLRGVMIAAGELFFLLLSLAVDGALVAAGRFEFFFGAK